MTEIVLGDIEATRSLARRLAPHLGPGDVIALAGPLGAGKTAFARFLIEALAERAGAAPPGEVPSPTFTLVQVYETGATPVWHFDLFRLGAADDVLELGIEEAFAGAISLVEWPDRLGPHLPADRLVLSFALRPGERRTVRIAGHGSRGRALAGALAKAAA